MDKLKDKRERRGELLQKMTALFDKAEGEKREFTADEQKEYDLFDSEIERLDDEIPKLEKMEERKAQAAKEEKRRKDEAKKLGDEQRSDDEDPKIEVTNKHLKTKEARNAKVFSMIQGHVMRDSQMENEARKTLAEAGFFDDVIKKGEERAGFSTLKDGKGGVLIPTVVHDEILTISQSYGVVPRLALNIGNILQNNVKVPQVMSRPAFAAVNQGSAIGGTGFNLGGIELHARKWGAIIDWTNEVDESVGAKLMPIIMTQLGEAFAEKQDDVFFNGTGTSAYNNIKGLEGLTGNVDYVRTATADSDHDSFAELTADDWLKPQENVAPGVRSNLWYIMHPDMEFHVRRLKDGQGKYIYGDPSDLKPFGSLWGRPIAMSEAFAYTDGATKTAGAIFNPRYLAYATGRSFTFKLLDQGTIKNEDGTDVNLSTQDSMALRVTGLFDMVLSSVTRSTAGTAKGAFSVLRTFS